MTYQRKSQNQLSVSLTSLSKYEASWQYIATLEHWKLSLYELGDKSINGNGLLIQLSIDALSHYKFTLQIYLRKIRCLWGWFGILTSWSSMLIQNKSRSTCMWLELTNHEEFSLPPCVVPSSRHYSQPYYEKNSMMGDNFWKTVFLLCSPNVFLDLLVVLFNMEWLWVTLTLLVTAALWRIASQISSHW